MQRIVTFRTPFLLVCLAVLVGLTCLPVFASPRGSRFTGTLTSSSSTGNLPGPLVFGSNLSLYNAQDFFVTDSATQHLAQQAGIRFMRFPDRGDRAVYLAAAQEIKALGMTPLAILPYNNVDADLQLVHDMNGVFGQSIVYYEYGNEQDLQGVDVTAYTASWNTVVPSLKSAATNANFIGPVNFQVNPSYIATFAANANPRPDEVSWHEYTCSANDSEATCLQNLLHWSQHIAAVRSTLQQTIGTTLPVLITEWNIDPNPPDSKLDDPAFVMQWTQQALSDLASSGVFGSNEYVLSNNQYLAMISDATHSLTTQGQAFEASALQQPLLTPTMSPTSPDSTPTPSPTMQEPGTTPTATGSVMPTATPSPSPIPAMTPSPMPTATDSATPTPATSPIASPTGTPSPVPTILPTSSPTPSPTLSPTASPPVTPPVSPTVSPPSCGQANTPTLDTTIPGSTVTGDLNSSGFSWLHVNSRGQVVTDQGCFMPLVGVTMGLLDGLSGLHDGSAGSAAISNAELAAIPQRISWFKQHLLIDVVRLHFNVFWWDANAWLPQVRMPYRQWLEQYVAWQEQAGNYVELAADTSWQEPPCEVMRDISIDCPTQAQTGAATPLPTSASDATTTGGKVAPLVQAWTDVATLYAADPAILYQVWDESQAQVIPDDANYDATVNTLIDTIRTRSPRSLIMVPTRSLDDMQRGTLPDYQQPNLIFAFHVYDGFHGISPATGTRCDDPGTAHWSPETHDVDDAVDWLHQHQQGVMIDEWGGCYDEPVYHDALTFFAQEQDIGLVYNTADNLVTQTQVASTSPLALSLNENGERVAMTYRHMLVDTGVLSMPTP